ncbi:MAG: ferritin-like domain-containing protein [Planctomycetes bacterium]|nr:ferritin-like domain-containing protein [Planctomycetota bacterium]
MPRVESCPTSDALPAAGSVERWCHEFATTCELQAKLEPPAPPDPAETRSWEANPPARRLRVPGRPRELRVVARSPSAPRPTALRDPRLRAELVHTFVHHELQAAELFAWAVLAFPATPLEFRRGLLRLALEELEHLALYRAHLRELGIDYGAHPVRDWFWQRVPTCTDPAAFVALQGLGLEGANLEHSARYAAAFRAAGDEAGARILERVEQDEIAHVAFARQWFERFSGRALDYDAWRAALPAPLSPAVLQGRPLNRIARRRAGLDEAFLARLEREPPTHLGRRA